MIRFFERRVRARIYQRGRNASGIEISANRITFDVEQTQLPNANKGNISFYNLSRDTRNFFEQKQLVCELYAGHAQTVALVFVGDLMNVNPDQKSFDGVINSSSGPDIITRIDCRDADFAYNTPVSIRAPAGESKKNVIDQVITNLGLTKGTQKGAPDEKLTKGFSFSGLATDLFTQLTQPSQSEWAITNEIIDIKPVSEPVDSVAVVISPETGLFEGLQKRSVETKKGFAIAELQGACILNPLIKPGKLLRIYSRAFSKTGTPDDLGFWITQDIKHHGDSMSDDFTTEFRALKYGT